MRAQPDTVYPFFRPILRIGRCKRTLSRPMIDPSPRPSQPVMKASPKQTSASHHLSAFRIAVWALLWCLHSAAWAVPTPAARTVIPPDKVTALGPLLRGADLALLESHPNGQMRQITLFSWAAAPPDLLHYVVSHPERYRDFARNMTVCEVKQNPDGSIDQRYEFSYPITTVGGTSRFVLHAAQPGQVVGAIDCYDPEKDGPRWHRWEFVPYQGGTIVVLSGYTDVLRSGYPIDRLIQRVPTLEYGLAMIGQMTPLLTMKQRAEQLTSNFQAQPPLPASEAAYSFLLEKGVVVLLRKNQGRLSELTLVSESGTAKDTVYQRASKPDTWSQMVPSITKSQSLPTQDGTPLVELEQSIPLLSFQTRFGVRIDAGSVDMLGFSGDLRGARMRIDLRLSPTQKTLMVFRSSVAYDRASLLIRQLYKLEPLFEYGVNVGLSLVYLRGLSDQTRR